jgi:hypothetical protein
MVRRAHVHHRLSIASHRIGQSGSAHRGADAAEC